MSTGSTVGVLALQGAFREHRRILELLGARTRLVRGPEDLDDVVALVIPGGESTTMSRLAVDLGLLQPVAERIAGGMPAFGTCAGMIMLADRVLDGRPDQEQFGGLDLTVRRNAFGRQVDSFEQGVDIPAIGSPDYPGVFIRAPWVESAGARVEVLGTVERESAPAGATVRIVAVRQGPVLATSFHPELTDDRRLHTLFLSVVS